LKAPPLDWSFRSVATMSFSDLLALTADLSAQDVAEEMPAPQPGLGSCIEAREGGLAGINGQQARMLEQQHLLDAVTALAHHVVRSPLERASSDFEFTGSPVMLPSAVPPVRPTNTPDDSFQICSAQAASADNLVAKTLSRKELPPPPVAPPGVACAQQFSIQFPIKKLLLACNPLAVARIRCLMFWTMILSLTFRIGFW
jgi:hypothetical protein